ncbi:MAG: hypothetical protein GF405_03335 [Candidatus Eisenbacteria bacterium]|nr:hypothetical protein [Candidatus Eisenbacteria bacterium]
MSFIKCDGTEPLSDEQERLARSSVLAVHACSPRVLDAHVALYRAIAFGEGPLPRSRREMIAVAVSSMNGCLY